MKQTPLEFEKPIVELEEKLADLKRHSRANDINLDAEVRRMEEKIEETKRDIYQNLTPWQRVQIARHPARPFTLDYLQLSFSDFIELHGDRLFADDRAMPGGLATIGRAQVRGHRSPERPRHEGKPQAQLRLRQPGRLPQGAAADALAEKFGLPFVALIDTPGAYPGVGAEERHISEAIAVNLREMMVLRTPIVAVVIGEGGSRRRARHRRCRPRADAGKRLLLRDQPRGLRRDSCGSTASTRPKPPPR